MAKAAVAIQSNVGRFALDRFAEFTPAPEPGLAMTAIAIQRPVL